MRAKYAAMDPEKKASLLAKKRLQRASRLLPAASSSSASVIPLAPPSLSEAVPFARSAPHVLADVQVPRPLVLDDHAQRSARNEKARARYATMNPNKKAEFLAKQRHKRSLLRSSPNLVASRNNVPAPSIQSVSSSTSVLFDLASSTCIQFADFKGNIVFIPRIPLESSDKIKCPIPFKRMQIPVRPCFVMTINRAQGQALDFVGIYLREPVFSHGLLYVDLSRAKCSRSIKILIHPEARTGVPVDYTRNVVFRDIFLLAGLPVPE